MATCYLKDNGMSETQIVDNRSAARYNSEVPEPRSSRLFPISHSIWLNLLKGSRHYSKWPYTSCEKRLLRRSDKRQWDNSQGSWRMQRDLFKSWSRAQKASHLLLWIRNDSNNLLIHVWTHQPRRTILCLWRCLDWMGTIPLIPPLIMSFGNRDLTQSQPKTSSVMLAIKKFGLI